MSNEYITYIYSYIIIYTFVTFYTSSNEGYEKASFRHQISLGKSKYLQHKLEILWCNYLALNVGNIRVSKSLAALPLEIPVFLGVLIEHLINCGSIKTSVFK